MQVNLFNKTPFLICVLLSVSLNILVAQEQENFKHRIEISTDNDAFNLWENFDRYYTYGAGIKYAFKSEKLLGLENLFSKKQDYFFSASIRSEGYTPTRVQLSELDPDEISINIDRPFAGLLYGTFDATYTFKNSFIKTELYLGIMGPTALSKEIQDWIHDNITDDDLIDGWEFQMPDQLILNINVSGAYDFNPESTWFDAYGMGEARIGNLYIDATPTLGFRIGKFGDFSTSAAFGNSLIAKKTLIEFYLRSSFSATFTAFNGTAQGNIFSNDFQYAVEDLSNFHTSMSHGLFVNLRNFGFSLDNTFSYGKVNKGVRFIYGSFSFNYRF